jgi:hypothetical protein
MRPGGRGHSPAARARDGRYPWPATRRRGGVATQRPAKPFTPVRIWTAPLHTSPAFAGLLCSGVVVARSTCPRCVPRCSFGSPRSSFLRGTRGSEGVHLLGRCLVWSGRGRTAQKRSEGSWGQPRAKDSIAVRRGLTYPRHTGAAYNPSSAVGGHMRAVSGHSSAFTGFRGRRTSKSVGTRFARSG